MKKRLLSILMALALCLSLLPVTALAADPAEQFPGLTPGETYWFDLSGANIPGNKNGSLPDDSLHWVPFTYAGTVNAYVLKSRSANDNTARGDSANAAGSTDPSNPIGYTYDHSLFIADYNVTSSANWNNLNGRNLIFGTAYTSSGVDYTLRVPSAGSGSTGSKDSERGTPLNNEWDAILDKANQSYQDNTVGYIKNWNGMDSWGQDTQDGPDPDWNRATRGSFTARSWQFDLQLSPSVGFRPVLELPSSDTLGSDGLATVTLDLNGGSIGSITGTVNLAVKSDFNLTLPGGTDVTRPDGNDGTYFMWQDSSGNLYEPGDTVPAGVGRLTAIWEGWTELTKDILDSTYKVYSVGAYFYRLPSGHYYLGEDISVDTGIDIGDYNNAADVTLDLNGYELKDVTNNNTGSLIFFPSTSSTNTLTLMDSSSGKTGKVIRSSGTTAKLSKNAKLNANGGTIEGLVELVDNTAVIDNTDPSNVTVFTGWVSLYDGTIKGGIFTGTVGIGGGTISDSAKVTVAFDSDGGSDVAEQKVLRGQKVSEPTAPTKAGYSFEGWYNGDTKYDFTGVVTENITLTARWKDSVSPVITGLENGKTYCAVQTVTVSDNDGIDSVTVNNVAVTLDENNQFTLPAEGTQTIVVTDKAGNETSVTVTVNNGHTYDAWQSNGNSTHTRRCTVDGCNGYEDGDCDGGEASYFKKAVCDICHAEYGNLLTDSTAPTGEISIGINKWNSFLNTITFGIFFKDTQSVTITANDNSYDHAGYTGDKVVKVEYYLHSGDAALTQADLAGKEFTEYSRAFNINPDNKYVVYVKLTDHAGNVTYISSEGVVLDASAPVISGVENGKTYCEAQTVTVTEEYIESVKVNGTEVSLENNQLTLNPAEGTQTIVATDHAGNSANVTVTVNDGHTYEWQDDNGQYWKKCKFCGDETAKKDIPTITINGADSVCITQDYKFSFTLPQGAIDAVYGYEFENKGDLGLPAIVENNELFGIVPVMVYEPSENSFKVYAGAKTADGFDISASKIVALKSEHTDAAPKDHICDICGATISKHTGGEATCRGKAICEYCGNEYGELDSTNHNLENIPAKAATVTATGNKEYWCCLDCGKYFADENGENEIELNDTVTQKLPPEIIDGKGQTVTEGEKKELTFRSNAAFDDFIRVELDGKTLDEKNYTVKEGSTVVTLTAEYVGALSAGEHTIGIVSASGTAATTFTARAKAAVDNNTKSPQTGDNSHTALWIALLFVSVGGVIGTTVVRKKKKYSNNKN